MTHLNDYAERSHQTAVDHGFWDTPRNYGEMCMLVTTEVSESLEEHRAGRPAVWFQHEEHCTFDTHSASMPVTVVCTCTPKPEGTAVELIDAIIRLVDMAADELKDVSFTVEDVMDMKMAYNDTRPYKHGKKY